MDAFKPHLDYGNSEFDIRNHFTLTASYAIPRIKVPGQLLEGWNLNTTVTAQSGLPVLADDTTDDISGTGVNLDRWDLFGNPNNFKLRRSVTCSLFRAGTGSKFANNGCCSTTVPAACRGRCGSGTDRADGTDWTAGACGDMGALHGGERRNSSSDPGRPTVRSDETCFATYLFIAGIFLCRKIRSFGSGTRSSFAPISLTC